MLTEQNGMTMVKKHTLSLIRWIIRSSSFLVVVSVMTGARQTSTISYSSNTTGHNRNIHHRIDITEKWTKCKVHHTHVPSLGCEPVGSAWPVWCQTTVSFPVIEHHCPLTGIKLYTAWWHRHMCEQLAQGCYLKAKQLGIKPATFWVTSPVP